MPLTTTQCQYLSILIDHDILRLKKEKGELILKGWTGALPQVDERIKNTIELAKQLDELAASIRPNYDVATIVSFDDGYVDINFKDINVSSN